MYKITSERGQPLYKGQNAAAGSQRRGPTVAINPQRAGYSTQLCLSVRVC